MPREVQRWRCEHEKCGKTYSTKKTAAKHEHICIHNPHQRACPSCEHDADGCVIGTRPYGIAMVRGCRDWNLKHDYRDAPDPQ